MARFIAAQFIVTLVLTNILGLVSHAAYAAQSSTIAVIYPELVEPYRGVISSIIDGIQEQAKEPVKLFPLGNGHDISQLAESISRDHTAVIIALGKTGLGATERWRGKIPIIVGALLLTPDNNEEGVAGISLAADPELLLARLKQLAPSVKRVHVVYSPENSEWLVSLARASVRKLNLKLYSYKSNDIKSSALFYRDILEHSQPGEDAVWLLPDPVAIDGRITLPLLLRGAWNNDVLLFSSSPVQVKRGALFALFPDNRKMGGSLATMAESYIGDNAAHMKNNIVPLKDLQAAINVRTAEHIGLSISNEERNNYELVFPAH